MCRHSGQAVGARLRDAVPTTADYPENLLNRVPALPYRGLRRFLRILPDTRRPR
jgi:hypothetical protein